MRHVYNRRGEGGGDSKISREGEGGKGSSRINNRGERICACMTNILGNLVAQFTNIESDKISTHSHTHTQRDVKRQFLMRGISITGLYTLTVSVTLAAWFGSMFGGYVHAFFFRKGK